MKRRIWFAIAGLFTLIGLGIALLNPVVHDISGSGILGRGDLVELEQSQFCRQYRCQKLQGQLYGPLVHLYGVTYNLNWYQIQDQGVTATVKVYRFEPYPEKPANPNIEALEFIWQGNPPQAKLVRWSSEWFRFATGIKNHEPLNAANLKLYRDDEGEYEWPMHRLDGREYASTLSDNPYYSRQAIDLGLKLPADSHSIEIWEGGSPI
jgi:hypothetical protein